MPDGYVLHEGRFIQAVPALTAANALLMDFAAVPRNRVRTYLAIGYTPSVSETRTVGFFVVTSGGQEVPLTVPVSILLNGTFQMPGVSEGMEIKLYPGEYIRVRRDVATAGSSMTGTSRFIDADLPYYAYEEPLKKVVQAFRRKGSVYKASGGISTGGGGGGGELGGGGEGGGGGEPVL